MVERFLLLPSFLFPEDGVYYLFLYIKHNGFLYTKLFNLVVQLVTGFFVRKTPF